MEQTDAMEVLVQLRLWGLGGAPEKTLGIAVNVARPVPHTKGELSALLDEMSTHGLVNVTIDGIFKTRNVVITEAGKNLLRSRGL